MEKAKNLALWVEEGYSLFANEGLNGIQVERLSRILQLNKSGFYHYFGDMEGYLGELIRLHERKLSDFLDEVRSVQQFDPDYLHLLIKHATLVMFQVHLTREKNNLVLYRSSEDVDRKLDVVIQKLWGDFLGVGSNAGLQIRYFNVVRDMFYTRISFQNLNYPFLHDFAADAKKVVTELAHA